MRLVRAVFGILPLLIALSPGATDLAAGDAVYATGVVFHDRNGNGLRDPGEEGIPGVRVSNQRKVVETDEEGQWRLPVEDDETIFFVIKPTGWMTPVDSRNLPQFYYIHNPAGSPALYFPGVDPTGPLPESIDFPLYPQEEPSEFRALFIADPQSRDRREIDYHLRDGIPEMAETEAVFGVTLGDIVHNSLDLLEPTAEAFGLAGIPWYHVIGNHDINFDATEDRHASSTFQRVFGPPYYSFEYGGVHFMVLDNIRWHPPSETERGNYYAGFGPRQMDFIRNELALIPKDRLVVVMMHIPFLNPRWRPYQEEIQELYELLAERPHTFSVSGHMHGVQHRWVEARHGWPGEEPHYHFVAPSLGGALWRGMPDETGIPNSLNSGGAPRGYCVFTFDGPESRFSLRFKAARRPADYQMNLSAPTTVAQDRAHETAVFANVFLGSHLSTVEMRLGESGTWQRMEQVARPDPFHWEISERERGRGFPPFRETPPPGNSQHLWRGVLPEFPPVGKHSIHVRTTDMFGQSYSAIRPVRIVPGISPAAGTMFADASAGMRIVFASEAGVEPGGIRLVLNGDDVTAGLAIGGDAHRREVRFDLEPNRLYEGEVRIVERDGSEQVYPFQFDTFDPDNFTWEAVHFNFDRGRFIDDPPVVPNERPNYRLEVGVQGIDKYEINETGTRHYRLNETVATEEIVSMRPRRREEGLREYAVGYVTPGEWLNYTRTFPPGRYHAYGRFSYARHDGRFAARMDRVTSDPGEPDQTTEKLGTFRRGRGTAGWGHYEYFPLLADGGEFAVVELRGQETLRVTDTGHGYGVAFYMLVPAPDPEERRNF